MSRERSAGSWVWGHHPVLEALRAGRLSLILISAAHAKSRTLAEIGAIAQRSDVPIRLVSTEEVARISPGKNMQGVAGRLRAVASVSLDDLLALSPGRASFILALDQIQDPQNFGALLRTADAAGVDGVITPERRSAGGSLVAGGIAKASAGAVSHVRIARVPNLVQALERLRRAGVWVAGLDGSAKTSIYDADLTVSVALVIGNEGNGLRRLTRESCDLLLTIPMFGEVRSLNASAAGAIAMYEAVRQRRATMGTIQGHAPT